jgi:hypothetical protein
MGVLQESDKFYKEEIRKVYIVLKLCLMNSLKRR